MQETMTSADLNNRVYGYGAGAGGMNPSANRNANDMNASYSKQHRDENHFGSTEYHDITSGLGNADTHIYYVF